MNNAYDSMDLNTAYEIAGGYQDASDEVFAKALEIVRADDASFAQELEKIRNAEQALNKKMQQEEDIKTEAEDAFGNASFIKKEFDDRNLEDRFFADEEVKEAEENTEIYDVNPDTHEHFEVQGEDKHTHFKMLFEKAKLDVWREQVGNSDFSEKTDEDKKKSLFAELKSSFLGSIAHLRTAAEVENEVSGAAKAIENDEKNFFVKQAGSILQKMEKAFDLKKKIKVSSSAVMASCAESEAKTTQFAKRLTDLAKKANGKNKEYFSKAAVLTHKAKEAFHQKAKQAWGQRYEFIASIKDRAPKITTNLIATGVLVGATAANAPWLGAAVVGYGAYKATSAWVWPFVTHARKEARLARQDENAPKISFFNRLKAAPKAIFSNKELRKTYFKEATWASAAGLIGLGAAGTVASVGGGALVQKSIQSLSSTAVYTANSLTNTFKTLKDKKKDFWSKGFAVVGTAVMSYVLVSCGENAGNNISNETHQTLSQEGAQADTTDIKKPVPETVEEVVEPTPVNVPEAWDENMKISEAQWNNMRSYFGDKFDIMYQKITDDMLKNDGVFAGKTREQVLFEYKQLGSWNLSQHKETLAKLDSFFGDCGGSLTAEDVKGMDDVLPNGGIRDVQGTECLRVTGRDIECGNDAVLHTQKVDCGCDNVVTHPETPAEQDSSADTSEEQTDFATTESFDEQSVVKTQDAIVTDPDLVKVKGNDLHDLQNLGNAQSSDVTSLKVASADHVLIEGGDNTEDFVTTEEFVEPSSNVQEQNDFVDSETFETPTGGVVNGAAQDGGTTVTAVQEQEGEAVEISDLKAVRGGYNNTGLSSNQYHKLESFFNSKGENAFEFYKEKITDEMLAKGGIFEGLTREQALFSYKQIVEWSDNKVGAFKDEIIALDHYFNGCDETIEATKAADIKGLVDRVNSDGTIDGVNGNRCVRTVSYTFNDCDENNIHNRVNADCGTTTPSGKKWDRMFTKVWNKVPEPEGFAETEEYLVHTHVHTPTEVTTPDLVRFKGNNIDVNDVKVTGNASSTDVTQLNPATSTNILVEDADQTSTGKNVGEKINSSTGPTGNIYLDRWISKSNGH